MSDQFYIAVVKGITSIAVCWLGVRSMQTTKGQTGVGWAILGLLIIWG